MPFGGGAKKLEGEGRLEKWVRKGGGGKTGNGDVGPSIIFPTRRVAQRGGSETFTSFQSVCC